MATHREIEHLADPDVDNAQEALISTFEFALVENLHRNDRRVLNIAGWMSISCALLRQMDYCAHMSKLSFQ